MTDKIVAFDVDGVILDSMKKFIIATNEILEHFNCSAIPSEAFYSFDVTASETWYQSVNNYCKCIMGVELNRDEYLKLNHKKTADIAYFEYFDGIVELSKK